MTSLYRRILKQGLKIAWQKKYLWFFGLFGILLVRNDADFEIFNRLFSGDQQTLWGPLQAIVNANFFSWQTFGNIGLLLKSDPVSLLSGLFVLLVILLLLLFLVWLVVISQAALVKNTADILASKTNNIKTGVYAGIQNFWIVLGLNILNKLVIIFAVFLISLPVTIGFFSHRPFIASLIFLLVFLVLIPVTLSISLFIKYAIAYRVIKGNDFLSSIRLGAKLFFDNWLISLEMAISLFFINFLASFVIILGVLLLVWPFFLLSYLVSSISTFLLLLVQILALVSIFSFVAASGSFLATFQVSSWTSLFLELISRGGTSKIARIMGKVL